MLRMIIHTHAIGSSDAILQSLNGKCRSDFCMQHNSSNAMQYKLGVKQKAGLLARIATGCSLPAIDAE